MSSYERSLGQELLGDELACLSYWLVEDTKKKGYFMLNELAPLLQAFRFDISPLNGKTLRKEFRFALVHKVGEIRNETPDEEIVIRFDLMRQIFLERGL